MVAVKMSMLPITIVTLLLMHSVPKR